MSVSFNPQLNYYQQIPYFKGQVAQNTNTQNNTVEKQQAKTDNNLLWVGLTGLAVLGTYLITRGHYKAKIPSSTPQTVQQVVNQTTSHAQKPVAEFISGYKPFVGIENVADDVKPVITQFGSRTRADFISVVDGKPIRETVFFSSENKPIVRFIESTSDDGKDLVRESYKFNDKGELSDVINKTTKVNGANNIDKYLTSTSGDNVSNIAREVERSGYSAESRIRLRNALQKDLDEVRAHLNWKKLERRISENNLQIKRTEESRNHFIDRIEEIDLEIESLQQMIKDKEKNLAQFADLPV